TTPTGTVLHTSEEDGGRPLTGQCSGPALVPSPSSPQMLAPHDQTCPPEPMLLRSIARLCTLPAEIAVTLPSWPVPPGPTTTTGRVSSTPCEPLPSSPWSSLPYDLTCPVAVSARLYSVPPATACTGDSVRARPRP